MGATRESSSEDGIYGEGGGADAVASCEGDDIYAKVSPGKRTRVQRVAIRDRTVAPFVLEVMEPLSIPTERLRISGGTTAEVSAHFLAIGSNAGAAYGRTVRSVATLRHLAESTGEPVPSSTQHSNVQLISGCALCRRMGRASASTGLATVE